MIAARSEWAALRPKLESLFLPSFGRPIQRGYLDWRYFDNGQRELLFSVEVVEQEVVASYSLFPVTLICNGETYRTALSMTTMTHPHWRGKGLFPKLAAELYTAAAKADIAMVWGFPNANSHVVFATKLDWRDICEIPTMMLDLTSDDRAPFAAAGGVQRDDEFLLDYPEMPTDGRIRVRRSKDYLIWRYARNPVNAYQNHVLLNSHSAVASYVVTKKYGDHVDLVDIQTRSAHEANVLISHVARASQAEGAGSLFCWVPVHDAVHHVVERLGFRSAAPVTYFGARALTSSAPHEWIDPRKWYVQMGDSDVY